MYTVGMPRGRPSKKPAPAFGARLGKLRQAQGLSQAELGQIIGISQPMVEYYERRAKNPGVEIAVKVAHALGVTTDELLGVEEAGTVKSGRKSNLDRLVEQVKPLPKSEQQYVEQVLEQVIRRNRP
jgi:transcriptional regulator with XRE-family HTH domain